MKGESSVPKLPSGLKTFEPTDTVRRIAQNENIEAIDALFSTSKGHRHTGKAGDAPQIGKEGIAQGAVTTDKIAAEAVNSGKIAKSTIDRSHHKQGGLSSNIAKFKRVSVTGGTLTGNPTTPYTFQWGSAGDNHLWSIPSNVVLPQSLMVNLGKEYVRVEGLSFGSWVGSDLSRIPKGFYVEVSVDGSTWTNVYTHSASIYEPFTYLSFSKPMSARFIRLTVTEHSGTTDTVISCVAAYSSFHGNLDSEPLEDERTWGLNARLQGLMIVPEGTITDNGAGTLTLNGAITIMNPASGTYFRVKSGTYNLSQWSYLYVDIPYQHSALVDPYVGVWTPGVRSYDHKDRIILAQRNGGNEIFVHSAIRAKLAGTVTDADKVHGIDFQTKNGFLEFNDGSGWKGVGIKSVQRGSTSIAYFYPNGVGSLVREVNISPVNPQKTFVQITTSGLSHWFQTSPMMDGSVCARLIDNNKLRFNFYDGFYEAYAEISWEVIEFA